MNDHDPNLGDGADMCERDYDRAVNMDIGVADASCTQLSHCRGYA